MGIAEEIAKLEELRNRGTLTESEFQEAKRRLLQGEPQDPDDSLGRAANRFVTYQFALGIIGLVLFIILFFTLFLPMFSKATSSFPF